jgi:hypothetical protein
MTHLSGFQAAAYHSARPPGFPVKDSFNVSAKMQSVSRFSNHCGCARFIEASSRGTCGKGDIDDQAREWTLRSKGDSAEAG